MSSDSPSDAPTVIMCDFTNDQNLEVGSGAGLVLNQTGGSGNLTMNLDGTLLLDGQLTLYGTVSAPTGFTLGPGGGTLYVGDGTTTGTLTIPAGVSATLSSGTLEVTAGSTLTGGGTLYNNSKLKLDLGSSTAGLEDYVQSSSGTLELEANMYMYSSLNVLGEASLAGTLDLDLLDGYTPPSGTVFTVVTAGSVDHEFNTTPPNMTPSYGPNTVTLTEN